ncbi:MAG: hypothetical protein U0587_04750 [Candidatus Binatia bacterium]
MSIAPFVRAIHWRVFTGEVRPENEKSGEIVRNRGEYAPVTGVFGEKIVGSANLRVDDDVFRFRAANFMSKSVLP